jgi:hypothetical protein
MDIRYAVALIEIKERDIANIKKKKRIILIIAEFYVKLDIYIHVQNFLLIEFPFNFEIVVFVLWIKYDFERVI